MTWISMHDLGKFERTQMDRNLPEESSSAIINVENEPPCNKQHSMAC